MKYMILQHICITELKIKKKVLIKKSTTCKLRILLQFRYIYFNIIFYNLYLYCTFCSILFSAILSSVSRIAILAQPTQ